MTTKSITQIVIDSGAYKDLDKPVILAGGDLGIYFVNAERVCGETAFIDEFGDDPQKMIAYAIALRQKNPDFDTVIRDIAYLVRERFHEPNRQRAISGGQRRDWPFSGAVAAELGCAHIAIFKDGFICPTEANGTKILGELDTYEAVHIADMLTKGSSAYDPTNSPATGWIPRLRENGVNVDNYITLITRKQGGEDILAAATPPIRTHAFVSIDEAFLLQHSKQPEKAAAYFRNPEQWAYDYLATQPLDCLLKPFNPADVNNLGKARNFMKRYCDQLVACHRYAEFDELVHTKYGKHINEIISLEQR